MKLYFLSEVKSLEGIPKLDRFFYWASRFFFVVMANLKNSRRFWRA